MNTFIFSISFLGPWDTPGTPGPLQEYPEFLKAPAKKVIFIEGTLERDRRHFRASGGLSGESWAVLKAILGILETSGGDLKGLEGVSKAVLGFLEASWTVLEASSAVSASLERILGGHGGDLGRSWGPLGWLWDIRGGY